MEDVGKYLFVVLVGALFGPTEEGRARSERALEDWDYWLFMAEDSKEFRYRRMAELGIEYEDPNDRLLRLSG